MGVASGGELAAKICNYVVALAEPYIVGRFLPMHALVLPPPNNIPLALVRAYIDEFAVNTELWASQTALTTLSAMEDTKVELHTFDEDDEHVNSDDNFPGTKGHVDLYQGGAQTHFQAMFGPFAAGFLKDGGIVQADWDMGEREGEGKSDSVSSASKLDFSASSLGRSDRDDAPRSGLASLFHDFGSYLHPEATASLTAQDRSWIESVVDELGWDFHQPADVVGVVYRAAAMLGRPDVFSLSPADAAKLVTAHERARDEKASGGATSSSHESQRRDPIIPLAGLVPELVECGIPLEEIGRLLPHANAYLAFHAQRSSWKAKDAGPRVQALKALAAILNQWAETYKQPQLRRGPSIAEHTTVPSPLAKGDVIGVNMRALLTIDPGDLVGFEPEESQTWVTFRDALQGFVRAHVLNKHVGGSGLPRNIGYLSGEDNTRMSKLGEEYVKKEVIENGKQIFFGVEMPMGRPDLTQSPHFLSPKIAGMLVNQVSMRVGEVMPFENEEGEKDVEFRNVFLRDELGVTDDDVAQSNSGALTFATETPNVDSLSRINVNHTKRIRTEVGKSTDMSLDAFALPVWARQVVAQAQRDLLKSPSLQERKAILGQVQEQLTGKVPDKDVAAQLSKLAEVGRQAATLANTQEKKEASGARHLMNPARSEFLAKHTLSETQQQQVAAMTDTNFQRVQTLLANGAKLHEAVNLNNLREPSYSRLLAALQQAKKKGGGIGSFFA
jgi:hypothetical protein